jgi:hypothetical protein
MFLVFVFIGYWFHGSLGLTQTSSQESIKIEQLDPGPLHRGDNTTTLTVNNLTQATITIILDLRAVPGFYFRNVQEKFIYLLQPKEKRVIRVQYHYDHLAADGFLRVRLYYPSVSGAGITTLGNPFFEKRFPVGAENPDLDPLPFIIRESRHYRIYYYPGSLAEHDLDKIIASRDRGFEEIAAILGVSYDRKIPLIFFPDEESKVKETGHHGAGLSTGSLIVEVYNQQVKLDPFHETAHMLAAKLGDPAALFNEGFAVYVSETLGADALDGLGSPGKTCDSAVREHRTKGEYIPLPKLLSYDDIGPDESRPAISYPEACSVVRFLIAHYGMERFRTAYSKVAAGDTTDFESIYGASINEIEQAWLKSIASTK